MQYTVTPTISPEERAKLLRNSILAAYGTEGRDIQSNPDEESPHWNMRRLNASTVEHALERLQLGHDLRDVIAEAVDWGFLQAITEVRRLFDAFEAMPSHEDFPEEYKPGVKIRVRRKQGGEWVSLPLLCVGVGMVQVQDQDGPIWIDCQHVHPSDLRVLTVKPVRPTLA